jgi:hypothetical protein
MIDHKADEQSIGSLPSATVGSPPSAQRRRLVEEPLG